MTKLETGRISPHQFLFAIACFIRASSLVSAFFSNIVKQDAWLVVALGLICCLPFLAVLIRLAGRFPQKSLFEIDDIVFGPIAGKAVSMLYLWFFLTLAALNLRDLGDFVQMTIMQNTPRIVIMVLFMVVCAWAVRHGIEVVVRYSTLFVLAALVILAMTVLLTLNHFDFRNFLPVLEQPPMKYVQSVNIVMTIPFGELVVFLMITPCVNFQGKKMSRYFLLGFLTGGTMLLGVVLRDTAVLGRSASLFAMPPFETMRMVTLTESISRMEVLFAVVLIILLFFKVSFLYYVTTVSVAKLLRLSSFRSLVLTVGAFLVVYAFNLYPSAAKHTASGRETAPIIWILFEFLLPTVTLLVAGLRGLPQRKGEG
jgi:spore germination protein KB